jgi:hypothetical protein
MAAPTVAPAAAQGEGNEEQSNDGGECTHDPLLNPD